MRYFFLIRMTDRWLDIWAFALKITLKIQGNNKIYNNDQVNNKQFSSSNKFTFLCVPVISSLNNNIKTGTSVPEYNSFERIARESDKVLPYEITKRRLIDSHFLYLKASNNGPYNIVIRNII